MLRIISANSTPNYETLAKQVSTANAKTFDASQPGPMLNLHRAPAHALSLGVVKPDMTQMPTNPITLTVGNPQVITNTAAQVQTQTVTLGETKPQTLGVAQALTLGGTKPLTLGGTQALGVAQALTLGGTKPLILSGAQPLMLNTGVVYPTADAYKQYDHRTHVYMKSDTYIGSDERVTREEWLFDVQNKQMVNATIDFTPGCERLFLEVLSNASDNVGRSRRAGVDPGRIDIMMDNSTVSITNYGLPIPIEIHPTEKVYVPQMIFGSLLTSSNYEVDRHEAGTNGIGAKAANIFSNEFMVIVHDHIRHLKYTQVWNANMTRRGEPIIEEFNGNASSVQVVYKMDFARFKYPVPQGNQGGYPAEAFALFARHAVDISFTAKTTVTFNGQEFNYANIREYARLYFGDAVDNAIIHYQWPAGTEIKKKKKGYQVATNPGITPEVELIAIDTPDEGHHVSFVNCMMTRDGGVHVNAAVKAVGDSAVKRVNDNIIKKLTKQNKGKELDAKEKRSHTITINDVKPHVSFLVSVKVVNPKFASQTKTSLQSPTPKIEVSEEELKGLDRWQLIDRLYAALDAKQFASLAKTDGRLKRYVRLAKGIDANQAGKAGRDHCVLYITEGQSGAGYANQLVGLVPGGRDHIGVLPMRGKNLNVMNADRFQIEKNAEINELKRMLGLVDCPDPKLRDTYYLDPKNFDKLRYKGGIMIMADSDVDGKHIIGLILNFFYCRFPSLLARGFVMYYRTPTLRVTFNRQTLKFYTQGEYDEWKAQTPNFSKWTHKYYKGLGTSKKSEVADDLRTARVVTCFYDEHAPEAMKLAFDKKLADQRKDWIGRWRPVLGVDDVQMQPISWFINHELILFSIADTVRSIPKLTDGLKESLRKVIHGMHQRWKVSHKGNYSEYKVERLSAFIGDKTNYHHGALILSDVIIGMAQDFTGSNNIPWFTQDGQFGCVAPDTPILLWNGSTKLARDITTEDILVGDDGKPRHISQVVKGFDNMFRINQAYGDSYTVNSKHILTLHYPKHKCVWWKESANRWMIEYFDIKDQKIKEKSFGSGPKTKLTKEQAKVKMDEFAAAIPDENIFDINIQTYLSFPSSKKELFRSVRNLKSLEWPKREVPIDPYIFGMWLGDGQQNGRGFASADRELVKEWVKYTDTIGVEVTHNRNVPGHEGYQYGFRRRGTLTGVTDLIAVGHQDHSSKTCPGCLTSEKSHPACDWVYENKDNTSNKVYDSVNINGVARDDMNPFVNLIKKHGLYKNKHIPEIYMINDTETRLQLLAGLIDTDGTLKCKDNPNAELFEISQEVNTHGHIIDVAEFIAKSLGFRTHVSIYQSKNSLMKTLSINGDIFRIPTKLPRKQSCKRICNEHVGSKIAVEYVGIGNYVGWYIDGNERFLLGDFTVTHNTRYEGGKDAAAARYPDTRPHKLVPYIIRKEDRPILDHLVDEGDPVEPKTYLTVIPMILVNGAQGIGTGYSTFVPCHDPLDVIRWLILKLSGIKDADLPFILPWYRGFQGVIKVIDRRRRKKRNGGKIRVTIINNVDNNGVVTPQIHSMDAEDEPEDNPKEEALPEETENAEEDEYDRKEQNDGSRPLLSMVTLGKFHLDLNGTIIITELPIGRWPHTYHKWLEQLVDDKKITGFRDLSVDNRVYFEIYGFKDTPNHRNLKLKRTMGMSNMVLLDENNRPVRYDTAFDILEAFHSRRLPMYQRRREYIIQNLTDEIAIMNHKIRFIQAVINKEIRIINRKKATIYEALDSMGIPHEIYDKSMNHHLSEDDITDLMQKIATKENERAIMQQTTPEQIWIRELNELEDAYRSVYGLRKAGFNLTINKEEGDCDQQITGLNLMIQPVDPNTLVDNPDVTPQRQPAHAIQLAIQPPRAIPPTTTGPGKLSLLLKPIMPKGAAIHLNI